MINIAGLNKADVLAALYNHSKPQGLGFLHFDSTPMTREDAQAEIEAATRTHGGQNSIYFDYLRGRVIKVDLGGDEFDPRLYDRDLGQGAAARVIATVSRIVEAA